MEEEGGSDNVDGSGDGRGYGEVLGKEIGKEKSVVERFFWGKEKFMVLSGESDGLWKFIIEERGGSTSRKKKRGT